MAEHGSWFRASVALLERFGQALAPELPDAVPGTPAWMNRLYWDVDQARRNDADRDDVLIQRRRRVRRASDEDARWAENLALARIETGAGILDEGRARVLALLQSGRIPAAIEGVLPELVYAIAWALTEGGREDGRDVFDEAIALADELARRRVALALLSQLARFERRREDPQAEYGLLQEVMTRLGFSRAEDPYRAVTHRRGPLQEWEREMLLWTGHRLLEHATRMRTFEAADQLLVELRAVLERHPKLSVYNARLLRQEGYLAYLRGDFARAADAWSTLHDLHEQSENAEHWVFDRLNLAFAQLRLGAFDDALRLARAITDVGDQGDTASWHRAHALSAEAALGAGDLEAARAHADQALAASGGIIRSAAQRVLAELHLSRGDTEAALSMARAAVDDFDAEAGASPFLVDRLITLARAAAPIDPALARAALARAAGLEMAPTHPFRRDIERARAQLG